MFNLEAGVDFEEVEVAGGVVVDELDRAGVGVAGGGAEAGGAGEEVGALGVGEAGCGGFFDDFLVAALDGAVAFAEGDNVSVGIAEDLDFNVAGVLDKFFEEDSAVFKIGLGETDDGLEGGGEVGGFANEGHADAAAAAGAFEHDGVADAGGFALCGFEVGEEVGAGQKGDAVGAGKGAGGMLGAELAHLRGAGADEGDAGGFAGFDEGGVFGEEAVTGVDGLGAGGARGGEDFVGVEVGLRDGGGAEVDGFVGLGDVEAVAIGLGIDGDGGDAHATESADDAAGDGSAVGDEDLGEHG